LTFLCRAEALQLSAKKPLPGAIFLEKSFERQDIV